MFKYTVYVKNLKGKINREIYGNFSEHIGKGIYEGIYVGEGSDIPNQAGMRTDVVNALKEMKLPVLRWPGGWFADEYHWMDGIGPKESRKRTVNVQWGGVIEDNRFGTHEFLELCEQIGCEPYISANVGSGTVQEMAEWIEYMTFDGDSTMANLRRKNGREKPWKIKYFGIGNESWSGGGYMSADYYADCYRRYRTYCRNYGTNQLYRIACGGGSNGEDCDWTETLMRRASSRMEGLSVHYYAKLDGKRYRNLAAEFSPEEWYATLKQALRIEQVIEAHAASMDKYDPQKRVGMIVDEWGTWFDVEEGTEPLFLYQQNTMRDALVAAVSLNIFNKHCDRVKMANIAQLANVLQAVILTEGEKMVLTPTYYVFLLYKYHQDSTLLESTIETCEIGQQEHTVVNLHESASVDAEGNIHITVCNLSHAQTYEIDTEIVSAELGDIRAEILTGAMNAHNTFEEMDKVGVQTFTDYQTKDGHIILRIPACSVLHLEIRNA